MGVSVSPVPYAYAQASKPLPVRTSTLEYSPLTMSSTSSSSTVPRTKRVRSAGRSPSTKNRLRIINGPPSSGRSVTE